VFLFSTDTICCVACVGLFHISCIVFMYFCVYFMCITVLPFWRNKGIIIIIIIIIIIALLAAVQTPQIPCQHVLACRARYWHSISVCLPDTGIVSTCLDRAFFLSSTAIVLVFRAQLALRNLDEGVNTGRGKVWFFNDRNRLISRKRYEIGPRSRGLQRPPIFGIHTYAKMIWPSVVW